MQAAIDDIEGESASASAVTEDAVRRIAEALVERHARAPRASQPLPEVAALAKELAESLDAIRRCVPELASPELATAERLEIRFLDEHADRLRERAADDRVLVSTADLRISEVSFDADGEARIESSEMIGAAAARPGDECSELAGLSVDLLVVGRAGLAERLISHYAGRADDFGLYEVIDHYERRCALLRGRRAAEAAAAAEPGSKRWAKQSAGARRLVALAAGARPLPPQVVVAVGGQVASGKSTLARALADRMGAPRIVADRARDQLLHGAPGHEVHETHWATSFESGFHDRIYDELLRRARFVLASGRAVVLDGCFARVQDRGATRALAREFSVPFRFVECRVDRATQQRRLREREKSGEAGGWQSIADALAADWQTTDEIQESERIALDTGGTLEAALSVLEARLPEWRIAEDVDA